MWFKTLFYKIDINFELLEDNWIMFYILNQLWSVSYLKNVTIWSSSIFGRIMHCTQMRGGLKYMILAIALAYNILLKVMHVSRLNLGNKTGSKIVGLIGSLPRSRSRWDFLYHQTLKVNKKNQLNFFACAWHHLPPL